MLQEQAEQFFRQFGDAPIMANNGAVFTVEELYQAIFRRMVNEPIQMFTGKLDG
jgi:hypothetical protein